jgi:type II secretory pathway component PulK
MMNHRPPSPKQQNGFILIYVVAMVAALATLVYQVSQFRNAVPRQTEKQLGRAIEGQEIRYLEEFILDGLGEHQTPIDPRYLAYRELEATNPARLGDMADAVEQLKAMLAEFNFNIDGREKKKDGKAGSSSATDNEYNHDGNSELYSPASKPHTIKLGERQYQVTVRPANAVPNLNSITYPPLWRYLEYLLKVEPAEAQILAANLIDWRDPDDFRTEGIGGESETYQPLGYATRNAPIRQWQEVAYIKGITPEYLQFIREGFHLGPADTGAGVLPDYISPAALAALADLKPETIRALLDEYGRQLDPGKPLPTRIGSTGNIDLIFGQDATRFDQAINWQIDKSRVRVQIDGPNRSATIDYDIQNKKIIDRWD